MPAREAALEARLRAALAAKGAGYLPRTRHRSADGTPTYTNRLILETSPYLLQHAHNPVDWFAWGDEAFERARTLGRPIFLSVGYSTCHWCHVMEEESFEDESIAQYMNEHYVCIKVDREERPDVDAVYMAYLQATTGNGGWPMNVWMTPSAEPFFGGTYFPPHAGERGARRGLLEVLTAEAERFAKDPAVAIRARELAGRLRDETAQAPAGNLPGVALLDAARAEAAKRFDPVMGGARGAPKFPSAFPVPFLLRMARRFGDREALTMATATLDHMREGGIADQVGGGFHRYATDARWLVPHFEKMLYDNALLAITYLEAAQATGDPRYARTVRDTLDYLLREMTAPDGTFYAATDADSLTATGRREEGVFFTWTPSELRAALDEPDARIAEMAFGVAAAGPVDGRSVLHAQRPSEDVARDIGLTVPELDDRLVAIRSKLYGERARRPLPLRDEKVILAWNALTVSAFARAALVLGDARYEAAAIRAGNLLRAPLREGRPLQHLLSAGPAGVNAFSDDDVFLAAALLDLFELTGDVRWFDDAAALMETVERSFADETAGGYFLTTLDHEKLLLRDKPDYDGPIPSVSSIAALTWLRLDAFTDDPRYRRRADETMRAFSRTLGDHPLALDRMLVAIDWATDQPKEIALIVPAGPGDLATRARPFLDVLARRFVPSAVLVVATEADVDGEVGRRVPWLRDKRLRSGRATAYVCERGTCQLPTNEPNELAAQLSPRPLRDETHK